jgi:hypothetical protein
MKRLFAILLTLAAANAQATILYSVKNGGKTAIKNILLFILVVGASRAHALFIDTFDTLHFLGSLSAPGQVVSSVMAPEVLGGERDASFSQLRTGATSSVVDSGHLNMSIVNFPTSGPIIQNITSFTYDGVDGGGGINLSNDFDLTDSGQSDRFIVNGFLKCGYVFIQGNAVSANLHMSASLFGTSLAENANARLLNIPLSETSSCISDFVDFQYELSFASLDPVALVDPSSVNALIFTFNTTATRLELVFDSICTGNAGGCIGPPDSSIPEPVTLALFGLGLAGLGFSRRRKV